MAREIVKVMLWNGQAVYAAALFEPETKDFAGKPRDKPAYSVNVRFPKTKAQWWDEPAFEKLRDACKFIMAREMADVPFNRVEFPVKDGDLPNTKNKTPEWGKGHWVIRADTTNIPKVFQMVGGVQSELPALRMGGQKLWGDGDFISVEVAIAKRMTDAVGIKCYLNSVLFTGKGAELSTGGASTDWATAMAEAKAAGIDIQTGGDAGFTPAPAGFAPAADAGPSFSPAPAAGGFNPGGNTGGAPF